MDMFGPELPADAMEVLTEMVRHQARLIDPANGPAFLRSDSREWPPIAGRLGWGIAGTLQLYGVTMVLDHERGDPVTHRVSRRGVDFVRSIGGADE